MADSFRDPFDDSESGEEDGGRPRTPEIHLGGDGETAEPEDENFSDISDSGEDDGPVNLRNESENYDIDSEAKSVHEEQKQLESSSPQEDQDVDVLNDEPVQESLSPISPVSAEEANLDDSINSKNRDLKDSEPELLQRKETAIPVEDESADEGDIQLRRVESADPDIETTDKVSSSEERAIESEDELFEKKKNSSADKNSEATFQQARESRLKSEDEDLLMSPIGDLGISEHEAAIVDDILKDDVGKYLPHVDERDDEVEKNEQPETSNCSDIEHEKASKSPEEPVDEVEKKEEEIGDSKNEIKEENLSDEIKEEKDDESEEAGPSQSGISEEPQEQEESEGEEVGEQLIADIFGASDEEEEFEGFGQEDIEVTKKKKGALEKKKKATISDDEDEDEGDTGTGLEALTVPPPAEESSDEDDEGGTTFVSDFDEMMRKKKEMNRANRRRRKDYDIVNDNDDIISAMITKMKEAAEEDRLLNEAKQAATKKLKMLPTVLKHMNKADLQYVLLDSGILPALKEWLAPLPDGSLPHLHIREGLLKTLAQFPALDTGALKMSGLGKAVMYLYRHPKEIRQNRDIAGKLINEWARPIFGVTANFKSMSREEREERDYQLMPKRRRLSSAEEGGKTPKTIDNALQGDKKALRPGDKGFIMRARVPIPSTRDYVVRPKWNQERMDFSKKPAKTMNRFQKQFRKFKDRKQLMGKGDQRAVNISIEGRHMSL